MGYTHYWKTRRAFTDQSWNAFVQDVRQLFDNCTVPLANAFGEPGTNPYIGNDEIRFNGVDDDSCDTCCITKDATDFEFCKTRQLPYDSIVVAVLKLARNHNPSIELSSDGYDVFD